MFTFDEARPSVEDFARSLEFETLLADLSARFVNLPPGEVDREIEDGLRRMCERLCIDLAILWQWSGTAADVILPTHAYCTQEGLRPSVPLREEDYPWARQQVLAGRMFAISSLEEYPAEAAVDRETCRRLGIKAGVCLPLWVGGQPIGAMGLNALRAERDWSDALLKRLQLVAQVFANALARRHHELSLLESEERLALAADSADAGLWTLDYSTGVFWATERARAIFGVSRDEVITTEHLEVSVHPDDRDLVRGAIERSRAGEPVNVEYRIILPNDERVRWINSRARPRLDSPGAPARLMGVSIDVTERRLREEALRQSYAEIERLKDRLQAESDYLKDEIKEVHAYGEITGQSSVIKKVLRQVEQVAPTDSSVLIRGETGTGKELVAQAIHRFSPRRSHVMVKINCAALPAGLVESELFGREKGAYTGALTRQVGRFEVADGSTLFLDEIGELSLELQAKLLRVLETGEFERLGSPRTIKVDVRVIAATNRDLAEAMRNGGFREDLYYRLSVFPIRVPPLRERAEDIPLLVWAFIKEFSSRMGKKITQVPRQTMEALQCRPWPGNVRQLRNTIEHAVIITVGETLTVPALDETIAVPPQTAADAEREHIIRVLEKAGWHIKGPNGAAAVLGLNPATLYSRMKKLGIRPQRQMGDDSR
jgi:formate hydrogenlyase transcriptional activator